jgi:hypothetical protein
MSSDLNNSFEKLIRNKIEDYRTPVDPSNWNAIEKSLIRRKWSKYLYTAAGSAAAIALFLIVLNLPNNDNQNDIKNTTVVTQDPVKETIPPTEQPEKQIPENQTVQEQPASNPAPV